jgi:hypothetical protein
MKQEEVLIILFIYLLIIAVGHLGPLIRKTIPYAWKIRASGMTDTAWRSEPDGLAAPLGRAFSAERVNRPKVVILRPKATDLIHLPEEVKVFPENSVLTGKNPVRNPQEKQARGKTGNSDEPSKG